MDPKMRGIEQNAVDVFQIVMLSEAKKNRELDIKTPLYLMTSEKGTVGSFKKNISLKKLWFLLKKSHMNLYCITARSGYLIETPEEGGVLVQSVENVITGGLVFIHSHGNIVVEYSPIRKPRDVSFAYELLKKNYEKQVNRPLRMFVVDYIKHLWNYHVWKPDTTICLIFWTRKWEFDKKVILFHITPFLNSKVMVQFHRELSFIKRKFPEYTFYSVLGIHRYEPPVLETLLKKYGDDVCFVFRKDANGFRKIHSFEKCYVCSPWKKGPSCNPSLSSHIVRTCI